MRREGDGQIVAFPVAPNALGNYELIYLGDGGNVIRIAYGSSPSVLMQRAETSQVSFNGNGTTSYAAPTG